MAKVETGGSFEVFMFEGGEVALVSSRHVSCTGAEGTLGHPIEYIALGAEGDAVCNYCDRRFLHLSNPVAKAVREKGEPVDHPGRVA